MVFAKVPGSPFAYWASDGLISAFVRLPRIDVGVLAVRGAYTTDDFKYYRLAWEVPQVPQHQRASSRQQTLGRRAYVGIAKGGSFAPYYSDVHLVVRWHDDGAEAKVFLSEYRDRKGWGADWSACLNGYGHYFRPGLTWPRRTNGLSFRALPAGSIFADKGPAAFVDGDGSVRLLSLLALANSKAFSSLVAVQLARTELAQSYEVGLIQQTPLPEVSAIDAAELAGLARRAWSLHRRLDTVNEVSHAFVVPYGLVDSVGGLNVAATIRELAEVQREVDARANSLYGIAAQDLGGVVVAVPNGPASDGDGVDRDDLDENEEGNSWRQNDQASAEPLLSWLIGCAWGRFDHRLVTGERQPPPEPEPFDPLPTRSPGMCPEGEPREVEPPAILVDEPHHKLDLVAHMLAVAEKVKVETPANLRAWLAKEFFPLHIKMYSKSRRKAPIYWQLATPSASYSVWLYIHAFTKDTMFHVEELVNEKVLLEERKANELRNDAGESPSAAARKAIAAQDAFLEELRGMAEEVRRVKPLWKPDLDDGVIINFAPLWRLVPQHKSWQKELRETWAALCAGEYDWSHLAMHLWPERVVPKCATDRSFAIAHGLEDVFWLEDTNGKWKPRATPTRPVADLIAERTSAAVTAARDSLINAPTPGGGGASKKKRAAPKARRLRR